MGARSLLLAGEFAPDATETALAAGFRKLGWRVDTVGPIRSSKGAAARALDRGTALLAAAAYRRRVLHAVRRLQPEVFLTVKGTHLSAALLAAVRGHGALTVNDYPDHHFEHPGLDRESFGFYDLFVTTKSFHVPWLRARLGPDRVAFVHHGYGRAGDPPEPHEPGAPFADVLYVGNHTPTKQAWLSVVAEMLLDVRLVVAGGRWARAARGRALERAVLGGKLEGEAYARAVATSRIALAIHGGPAGAEGWADYVSTRTFEIPAFGGFMLHVDNPEVRTLFEPDREIGVFSTPHELCGRIRYYLERPELRLAMARRAYARAVPAYSYDVRAAELAALIEDKLAAWGSAQARQRSAGQP